MGDPGTESAPHGFRCLASSRRRGGESSKRGGSVLPAARRGGDPWPNSSLSFVTTVPVDIRVIDTRRDDGYRGDVFDPVTSSNKSRT